MAKPAKNMGPEFSADAASAALHVAWQEHLSSIRAVLCKLVSSPPQVLLLEGGSEDERLSLARFWATLHHCEQLNNPPHNLPESSPMEPCGQCGACLHIGADIHADVLVYDGRISNTEDEENPQPIRALTKDNAVQMKSRVADTTSSGKKRVVIMNGIEMKRSPAANTLLKVLEEPSPTSVFVLLAPQREQLLPTLVSRSWVLTLPWPETHKIPEGLAHFEQGLATFLQEGRKWWSLTSAKGAVDAITATQVVLLCQKCLLPALAGVNSQSPLAQCFAKLGDKERVMLVRSLEEAQESLLYNVHPARVLDALATQIFTLYHRK